LNNGGCPITSYAIFRDDGDNGDFSVNMEPEVIGNNPYLFEHVFVLPAQLTGLNVRFKLQASNVRGDTISTDFLSVLVAGLPAYPAVGPQDVPSITEKDRIGLTLPKVEDNGGSVIVSYHLMMDDGKNGDFKTVIGLDFNSLLRSFTITDSILKGHTFRFKYRVKNNIGWTEFSPVTYILAASVPIKPPAAKVVSTADTQIVLQIFEPVDNGGSVVTKYDVYLDSGSGYGVVATIDHQLGVPMTVTVT